MSEILTQVAHAMISVVSLALLVGLRVGLRKLGAFLAIKLDEADQKALDRALEQGVAFAEEQAHRALGKGEAMDAGTKLQTAMDQVKTAGFDMKPEELEPLIAAKLGAMRLRGRADTTTKE